MSVHVANISKIGTHGSQMEPGLENVAGDSVRSQSRIAAAATAEVWAGGLS